MLSWVHCSKPEATVLLSAHVLSFGPNRTPFGLGGRTYGNATIFEVDVTFAVQRGTV
jgi:hypothetical protein